MNADTSKWSGEGTFTQTLLDWLEQASVVAGVRVEDAPASRSEADYNFISNEIFVVFKTTDVHEPVRRLPDSPRNEDGSKKNGDAEGSGDRDGGGRRHWRARLRR